MLEADDSQTTSFEGEPAEQQALGLLEAAMNDEDADAEDDGLAALISDLGAMLPDEQNSTAVQSWQTSTPYPCMVRIVLPPFF